MFDSVYINCPDCNEPVEFQSKAGDCSLNRYTLDDAPPKVMIDIAGSYESCPVCDRPVTIQMNPMAYRVE